MCVKITVYYIVIIILISTVLCLCCPASFCFLFWLEIKQNLNNTTEITDITRNAI